MSLIGAVLTIATVSLAKMEMLPWMVAYVCGGLWVLGFVLGTRAQWRSSRERRLALTEGQLVALGVVEPDEALRNMQGRRPGAGRALVLLPQAGQDPEGLRNASGASKSARTLYRKLDSLAASNGELKKLREDRFCFERVPLPNAGEGTLTRLIIQPDYLGPNAAALEPGSVVWGIYHPETNILEQALIS